MYRFRSIKYISITGIITGLLVTIGYTSSLFFGWVIIGLFGSNSTLQLFDAIFIPFCAIFKGPMMLFAGPIAGSLLDLLSGLKIVTIPITILLRILMFAVIKLLTNKVWWTSLYSFFLAAIILMIGYPIYYLIIFKDTAIVINELIIDVIQGIFAYSVAIPLYYSIDKKQIKSNYLFWDDHQFDYLKSQNKKNNLL